MQLDGILQDAEARFRAIGSGSELSGEDAWSAAFLANLRDAVAGAESIEEQLEGERKTRATILKRERAKTSELARLKEQYEGALATIEILQDKEALSDIIASQTEELEGLKEQNRALRACCGDANVLVERLEEQYESMATSNRINQDALEWVEGVVYADVVPAEERMAELRHHFERGTFPVSLLRRASNPAKSLTEAARGSGLTSGNVSNQDSEPKEHP